MHNILHDFKLYWSNTDEKIWFTKIFGVALWILLISSRIFRSYVHISLCKLIKLDTNVENGKNEIDIESCHDKICKFDLQDCQITLMTKKMPSYIKNGS